MDAASSIDLVTQKAEIPKQKFRDILNDPKKTLYFMIAVAVAGAVVFVTVNTISDIFTANSEVKKLQQPTKKTESETLPKFDDQRKQDVAYLNSVIQNYYAKNKSYPQSLSSLIPQYLAKIPLDPETQREYPYRVGLDFKSYEVWAVLDNGQDYLFSN